MLFSLTLVPLLGAMLIFAIGPHAGRSSLVTLASGTLLATLLLAVLAIFENWQGSLTWNESLRLQLALNPIAATLAVLVPVIAIPIIIYAIWHEPRCGLTRLTALLVGFVGAMELLVTAADLLTLIIGWEAVGACSWALIAHDWRDIEAPRSGLYAFIMTRTGDLGLLLAAMVAFTATGSFAYTCFDELNGLSLELVVAGLLVSACAKSGQLPFSTWLFRAMDGPTPVSALLHAATMVAAGAYLLIRLEPQLSQVDWFAPVTISLGLTTALAGGVVALLQSHSKKLLAASTSAHFGLMLVAIGSGYPGVALLHLVVHAAFKALLFLAAGTAGAWVGSYQLHTMRCGKMLKVAAACSAVGAMALAGLPPLGGGWTKEMITAAAGQQFIWLALLVMIAGGLSAAYAARFQLLAYGFDPVKDEVLEKNGEISEVKKYDNKNANNRAYGPRPSYIEQFSLLLLALLSLLLTLLWWPALHDGIAQLLNVKLPESKIWELALSLLTIGLGLYGARLLVASGEGHLQRSAAQRCANWFELPWAIDRFVVEPVMKLARGAAWLDDCILDRMSRGTSRSVLALSRYAADADKRVVDYGAQTSATFGDWLSTVTGQWGEWVSDGLPSLSARLIAGAGRDSRRLQTGLSHHYYILVVMGALILFSILLLGSF